MMKRGSTVFVIFVVLLAVVFFSPFLLAAQADVSKPSPVPVSLKQGKAEVMQKTQKLQIPFIANKGQVAERVMFYANTFGGTVFITKDGEIVYSLPKSENSKDRGLKSEGVKHLSGVRSQKTEGGGKNVEYGIQECRGESRLPNGCVVQDIRCRLKSEPCIVHRLLCTLYPDCKWNFLNEDNPDNLLSSIIKPKSKITGIALTEELVGTRVKAVQGEQPSITKVNYFKGNAPEKWKTNIATYDVVNLGEVYEGIELKLKAYGNNVEKLFCVKPGADPRQIKVRLSGANPQKFPLNKGGHRGLLVNEHGELEVTTELGPVKFTKPVAYQEIDGKRVNVTVEYNLLNLKSAIQSPKSVYGFKVAAYDKTKELLIDPLLASTFLGGDSGDDASSMAIDEDGNVYVAGRTTSSDFPTTNGAYDTSENSSYNINRGDVFVSKLDGTLTNLLASTYLGGSRPDQGEYIVIDSDGNVYVTGTTFSKDFPTTIGAYNTSNSGYYDAFVSKLSGDLTNLLSSTYLGGNFEDFSRSTAIDKDGNIYLAGYTYSSSFPITDGAYDTSYDNDSGDIFLSKLSGDLTNLLASTYLGGSSWDVASSMAVDQDGNVYVTGYTWSSDFPTTVGAYDTSYNSDEDDSYDVYDAFVSRLNGDLTNLLASTYLGGSYGSHGITEEDHGDYAKSITIDQSGNVYVVGSTSSEDFPTTADAYNTSKAGYYDAFVSKLNRDLTSLIASIYLGGESGDFGNSIAIDSSGNVYVVGYTPSSDFPTTVTAYDTSRGGRDAFVSKFDTNLSASITEPSPTPTPHAEGMIYGNVVDTKGNPIESAKITCKGKKTKTKNKTNSNEDGYFEFNNLEADTYTITVKKKGYKYNKKKFTLFKGEEKEVKIVLKKK